MDPNLQLGSEVIPSSVAPDSDSASSRPPLRSSFSRVISYPSMLAFLLVTVVFTLGRIRVADPDIWWHLRNAENLIQSHRLLRQDVYSFTVAGHPWMNYEWLAEIPYYLAWRAGGLVAVQTLIYALAGSIILLLLYLCYKVSGNIKASVLACCMASFLASVSYGPRTILFGYLYLVLLLILLERLRSKGRAPLWLIPPLFCLWVNTHGSWLLGLICFGIVAAAGCVEGRWGRVESRRWTPSQLRGLVVTGVASVAALFVNPFGWRLVWYPFDLAYRQKLNIEHIAEWVTIDFHTSRGKLVMAFLVVLLLAALLRDLRWTLAEMGLLLFGLYCGLTYIRFLVLFGILAAPVLAKILDFVPPYAPELDQPLANVLFIAMMLAGMTHYFPRQSELADSVAQQYPMEALPYLREHPPSAPMLNFYLWGGYLEWHDRDVKVFVDSRVDIFEYAGVFQDYLDLLQLRKPEEILNKYRIRSVLFPPDEPLAYVLRHDPGWKVVYQDPVSVLFERIGEPPAKPSP